MISKLFKKPTVEDFIEELKNTRLNESKIDSLLQYVNVNHINQDSESFLHLIIPENKIESVKWLLKNNIDVNITTAAGLTALMTACKFGFIDIVNELLKSKADINLKSNNGYSAIEFAIFNGYYNIYKRLKSEIDDINIKNKKGQTLLHIAVKSNNHNIIQDLLHDESFFAPEDILFYQESYKDSIILNMLMDHFNIIDKKDKENKNILFYAVEKGIEGENLFLELLEVGLDINCLDKNGNNILLHLIQHIIKLDESLIIETNDDIKLHKEKIKNLLSLIPLILENGIDHTICNNKNETILSLPIKHKNIELLTILLENEVDINIKNNDNQTALSLVAIKGSSFIEFIHLLLDYGANPNIKDKNNKTIIENLINATLIVRDEKKAKTFDKKDLDFKTDYIAILVSLLVNTDANLNTYNSKGEPYFFEALRYGATDIVKLLIKHGADVNQVDEKGANIIYKYMDENQSFKKESEQKEYYNNLQAIIIMGANINTKDEYGGITLHKAILNCDTTVIKMLLHSGADINAIDNRGRHIIHNSIWKNNIKIFKLVYTYNKTLLNDPDKFGVMPINYAAFLGYTDLVLEFIELNAHINNPYKKTKYILNFLKKFHKNLKPLIDNARTKAQKEKLKMLVDNMRKEFEVID